MINVTRQETDAFMKRIKFYYQDFVIDDPKMEEWHKTLRKYDADDVNKKLEDHLSNEIYGKTIPKLHFLVKYLQTTEEKNKPKQEFNPIMFCDRCGKKMRFSEWDNHHRSRCLSTMYLMKVFASQNRFMSREDLDSLTDEQFNKLYELNVPKRIETPNFANYVVNKI